MMEYSGYALRCFAWASEEDDVVSDFVWVVNGQVFRTTVATVTNGSMEDFLDETELEGFDSIDEVCENFNLLKQQRSDHFILTTVVFVFLFA